MNQLISGIMQDSIIRKQFGGRVKILRKQKGWTQKQLAAEIGIKTPQLNKYECGLHSPPLERLLKLAQVLNTTIDHLVTGNTAINMPLNNAQLLERFHALESFNENDQVTVITLIDAMIVKRRVEGAINSI